MNLTRDRLARNRVAAIFPVTTVDGDRLGVRNCFANVAGYRSSASLGHGLHHCVVDGARTSLITWYVNGVVNRTLLGLVDRTTNGVWNHLSVSIPNTLHHSVVDGALLGLVLWHVDGVTTCLRFVNRTINCVVDRSSFGFICRYVHGVVDRTLMRLIDGLSHCVIHGAIVCLSNVVRHVDRFRVVDSFAYSSVGSELLRLHNCLAYSTHDSHRSAAGAAANGNSTAVIRANGRSTYGPIRDSAANNSAASTSGRSVTHTCNSTSAVTTTVTRRAAARSVGELPEQNGKECRDCWYRQSCFHLRNS